MKEKIRQFMIGRYGTDGLNQFLNIASLVLILVYILTRLPLLLYVGVVLPPMPSSVVAPVLPASSQLLRRVLLVPPPAQDTETRP